MDEQNKKIRDDCHEIGLEVMDVTRMAASDRAERRKSAVGRAW